jgi:UDP-glucose 4-epimerase
MDRPNAELMAASYPSVPLREGTGDHDSLLSIAKARHVLGYEPAFSWRDALAVPAGAGPQQASER